MNGRRFSSEVTKGAVTINWNQIQQDWKQFGKKLKDIWSKLNDEDLCWIDGHRVLLIDVLQRRYEYKKERAELELDHVIYRLNQCNWLPTPDVHALEP